MKYDPVDVDNLLVAVTYGSHLYGTSTPTSDHDFKVVTLPSFRDLILAKPLRTERFRFDAQGNPVGDHTTMPANGYEAEHTPVHKFVHDYLGGQAYAVETVHAVLQGAHTLHRRRSNAPTHEDWHVGQFEKLVRILARRYLHKNVNGMVGFAVKQTFDYVRRGERLNAARAVLDEVNKIQSLLGATGLQVRLDTPLALAAGGIDSILTHASQHTVLEEIVKITGLETGESINHGKPFKTLKLNGREYLETTTLGHFKNAVEKLIEQYGDRSTAAAEIDVDWKSLSHAVRVYEQVIELLQTGNITFPRPNAAKLLSIRKGEFKLESVKDLLRDLDDTTTDLVETSVLPSSDVIRKQVEADFYVWLEGMY
jgi:hypothetical protein